MASDPATDSLPSPANEPTATDRAAAGPPTRPTARPSTSACPGYGWIVLVVALAGIGFAHWQAWVADDAFITFRHVANCLAGHGPVYNVGERVQAFTHPLWFLLLVAGASVCSVYAVAVALGIAATGALLAAVGLLLRGSRQPAVRLLLVALLLLSSHTFVDYQTSGLETGLSHLLVALLWVWLLKVIEHKEPIPVMRPAILGALLVLNRPDHVVLCALPMLGLLVVALRRHGPAGLLRLVLAAALLLGWYGFASVYYGTPFPNTAYAKTGLPQPLLWHRGFLYLLDYVQHEPIQSVFVVLAILGSVAVGVRCLLARRPGAAMLLCLTLAVVLHLAYVVHMGGDFMRGRFLGVVLVAGVLLGQHLIGRFLPDRQIARAALLALTFTGLALCVGETGLALRFVAFGNAFRAISDQTFYTPIRTGLAATALIASLAIGNRVFSRPQHRPWGARVFALSALVLGLYALNLVGRYQPNWTDAALLVVCLGVLTCALAIFTSCRSVRLSWRSVCLLMPLAAAVTLADVVPRLSHTPGDLAVVDEYSWYAGPRTASRFREPESYPRSWARQWAALGHMAREYTRACGPIALLAGAAGLTGYHAGPDVHLIDGFGLTDAFVARGTANPQSRIGHLEYEIPEGYLESLGAVNLLPDWKQRLLRLDPSLAEDARKMARDARWADPEARRRYDQTKLVVSGHLWSKERWVAILDFAWPIR